MREYETIFVLRPDIAEAQTSQMLDKVSSIIDHQGGKILKKEDWGKRSLAYRVRKHSQGIYYYYNYVGDSGVVAELERYMRLQEAAMRFLTVKLADKVDVEARIKEISEGKVQAEPELKPEKAEGADVVKSSAPPEKEEVKDA